MTEGRRDPFASLGDVQRRAVEQATDIVGRLLEVFDARDARDARDPLATDGDSDADPGFAPLRATVSRAVDLYLDLFRRTLDTYVSSIEGALRLRGVSVTGALDGAGRDLVLEAVDGEPTVEGVLFVHNHTGAPTGPLTFRITDLAAADGSTIASTGITLTPASVGVVDDASSARIEVRVDVDGAPAGTYHGHVLAADLALPVRLRVPGR